MKHAALSVCAALLHLGPAWAGAELPLRDPMRAPAPAAAAAPLRAGVAPAPAAPALAVRQLLLVDGQRYVVDAGRRRAVGDALGDARIVAIEDSAVVVRRAGQLQRLPLFAGVVKKTASEADAAASAPALSTALAPTPHRQHLQRSSSPP